MHTTIETQSGRVLDYADPRPGSISIEDIAVGLANTCRFNGQIGRYYSVAEHSVLVRNLVVAAGHEELAFAALMHDAAEAYTGDLVTPLKAMMERLWRLLRGVLRVIPPRWRPRTFAEIAAALDGAIAARFGLNPREFEHPLVKAADIAALQLEAGELQHSRGRGIAEANGFGQAQTWTAPWPCGLAPDSARRLFLDAYERESAANRPAGVGEASCRT